MTKMKPRLSSCIGHVPIAAFKARGLSGDARSRMPNAPGKRLQDIVKGQTLSVHHREDQRSVCNASSSFTVYAAKTRQSNIATRLIVPDLKLQFGERIQCVGQSAELGAWYLDAAPILAWTEGDNWVHHLQLPSGHHEFKLLIIRDNGTTHWEQGPNRSIEVPNRIDGIFEVKCQFEFTTGTETATIPFPVKEKDEKAIRKAKADHQESTGKSSKSRSSHRRAFQNDIIAGSELPDAMEGDSTEREPDTLRDAKEKPQRFSWERDEKKKDDNGKEEAMEGVNPPSSDPLKETEPSTDDKTVQGRSFNLNGNSGGPEVMISPYREQSTWSASGQAVLRNGNSDQSIDLNRPELTGITKKVFQAGGRPVKMYGGAEAKELEDGSVLVKFPADGEGEDIIQLVERLLGYYD